MAASISILDSILLTLSSIVSIDMVGGKYNPILTGRLSMTILTTIVVVFALTRPGVIVELSVTSSAGLLSIVPSSIAAIKWGRGAV
jgi:Na+/proline symporter